MKFVFALSILMTAMPAAAVYVCTDETGNRTYQDRACNEKAGNQSQLNSNSTDQMPGAKGSVVWYAMGRHGECIEMKLILGQHFDFLAQASTPSEVQQALIKNGHDASLNPVNLGEGANNSTAKFKAYSLESTSAELGMLLVEQALCEQASN